MCIHTHIPQKFSNVHTEMPGVFYDDISRGGRRVYVKLRPETVTAAATCSESRPYSRPSGTSQMDSFSKTPKVSCFGICRQTLPMEIFWK